MSLIDALRAVEADQGEVMALLREHHYAPPNADFSKRLRATGAGMSKLARTLDHTIREENATAKRAGKTLSLPHELTPQAFRPGPPDLWAEWDLAVLAWQGAMTGTSLIDVQLATARLGELAARLADAIDGSAASSVRSDDSVSAAG